MTKDSGHFADAYSLRDSEETKAHYRSWAQSYDSEVGEQNGYAQPARVAKMFDKYCPDRKTTILDAGCGSGLSGLALQQAGYGALTGCDFSPEMLEQAAAKRCYRSLFEADLNNGMPDVAAASFDALACVGVFSFGHVDPSACEEFVRVVKPGGMIIIALNEQFWEQGNLKQVLDGLESSAHIKIEEKQYGDHLPGHDVKGWVIAARVL